MTRADLEQALHLGGVLRARELDVEPRARRRVDPPGQSVRNDESLEAPLGELARDLTNRRLRKEIQRLETEMSFRKIEPREPADLELDEPAAVAPESRNDAARSLPSAPVYDVEPEDSMRRGET